MPLSISKKIVYEYQLSYKILAFRTSQNILGSLIAQSFKEKNMDNTIKKSVYTVNDVQEILRISRNTAYALVKESTFPVKVIKGQYRIPVDAFNNWLNHYEAPTN